MKVYIIYNSFTQQIEKVFTNWKDANDLLVNFPHKGKFIEEHEVVE